jgi:benzoyl-CoA reductase subunit B
MAKYKTEGLDCWGKAKELRMKYYQDYAWSFGAVPQALKGEVHALTEEPYSASVGANPEV